MMRRLTVFSLFVAICGLFVGGVYKGSAYAYICPPGTNNEGAETSATAPDTIDAFCAQQPSTEPASLNGNAVDSCDAGSFLGFPKWYKYIQGVVNQDEVTGRSSCQPVLNGLNDIWKVVAAIVEILLRVASLMAIGFIVWGGITYTTSQGQPDKTKQALMTIVNALIGLTISIVATAFITFVAGRF